MEYEATRICSFRRLRSLAGCFVVACTLVACGDGGSGGGGGSADLQVLEEVAGTQLDPHLVDVFKSACGHLLKDASSPESTPPRKAGGLNIRP